MIDLKKSIDEIKKPKQEPQVPKQLFWSLWEKHSEGKYIIDERNQKVVHTVFRYFLLDKNFDKDSIIKSEPSLDKGLLIYGDYGIGKSWLFEILHEIGKDILKHCGINQLWFRTLSAGSFVETYMKQVKKEDKDPEQTFDIKNYYKGKLYIDDLGFEKKAFNKTELFGEILFERNRAKKKTFVTTNLKPSEITDRYGERIGDRLPEMFNIIKWEGESFRK